MQRTRRIRERLGRWAAMLLVSAGLSWSARAADRVVIAEEFTNVGCGYCGYAGPALSTMLNNYPGTFTLVQYHVGDSYATTFGNTRASFYGMTGTPTTWFDGWVEHVGASSYNEILATYTSTYNQRRGVPTDVTISVTGTQGYSTTYNIRARISIEPGGTAKTLRIHMANVLDHWPSTPTYHRNGLRAGATHQDVTLQPGESTVVTRSFTFDSTSWSHQSDIRIVVWAQTPNSTHPAEIHQAAQMNWPFPPDCNANGIPDEADIAGGTSPDCNANGIPDECDLLNNDCNLNGVPDECDIAGGTSPDLDGNGVPDECEFPVGDLNCDDVVNFGDINAFVLAVTNATGYSQQYPNCDRMLADTNGDGSVGFGDINPFVALLVGG